MCCSTIARCAATAFGNFGPVSTLQTHLSTFTKTMQVSGIKLRGQSPTHECAHVHWHRYCMQIVAAALEAGVQPDEDGIEDAFELLNEVAEHARGGEDSAVFMWHLRRAGLYHCGYIVTESQWVLDASSTCCSTCSQACGSATASSTTTAPGGCATASAAR